MKAFFCCCAASVLVGCASVPPPPLPNAAPDRADVYVYFGTSESCSSHAVNVLLDGAPLARLDSRRYFMIKLIPGHHTLTAHDVAETERNVSIEIEAQGGQRAFRGIQEWGINCAPPDFFVLDEGDFISNSRFFELKPVHVRQPPQVLSNREFDDALAYFTAADPKPTIPESVRRLQIQAEAAIHEGNYEEAEGHFSEAIKLVPWWANGYYNHALILKELGEYNLAIEEMQRYLALNPKASDAREMKDMIYLWQRKATQ